MKDSGIYYIMAKRITELEQQNSKLINLLCERCDYNGVCEIEEIPCAVHKFKQEKRDECF